MTDSARIDVAAVLDALPAFPQLRGNRLRLRGPRADDADAVFALFSDPAVMRYWSRPPMTARAEAEGRIAEYAEDFDARKALQWVVATRARDEVIGTCALFRFEPRHRRAEIGYALRSDHWGRGLACEAVTLALDWGFRTLGLHRIEADIDPRNAGSRKLLERLGFASEGLLRERYFVGGETSDTELFGLLATGWASRIQ
jgi:ribosomal-protein-alanine N-acetyltransferase